MFSDIVGYTAMMQSNEETGKIKAISYRKILEEICAKHAGKVIQHYGDGSLTIFKSSVEAVRSAKEIQNATLNENIPLRIGIHLGDISIDKGDIYGDGINIASRVESLGIPGSILFTVRVFEDISSHPEFEAISMGMFHFKNDKDPREIFALSIKGFKVPTRDILLKKHRAKLKPRSKLKGGYIIAAILLLLTLVYSNWNRINPGKDLNPADIESLVILPFDNFTGDKNLEYVAAGMHSSLINNIGRVSQLRVIGKTSANTFENTEKSLPEIAKELNVDAIVEPEVLCYGDSVCVQLRVMTTFPEEKQLWAAEFKEEKSQFLKLYNKITRQIVEEIKVELTSDEARFLTQSREVDRDVYDAYLKSSFYWGDFKEESLNTARIYLEEAVQKDSSWAPLFSGLAKVWIGLQQVGYESPEVAGPKISHYLNKVTQLDPDLPDAHYLTAMMALLGEWDWKKAENEFLQALAINPNDPMTRIYYAHLLSVQERPDEALLQGKLALELDPLNPIIKLVYAMLLNATGDCKSSIAQSEKIFETDPDFEIAYMLIEIAGFRCKDFKRLLFASNKFTPIGKEDYALVERIHKEKGFVPAYRKFLEFVEPLGHNERLTPTDRAFRYYLIEEYDKAIDWLEIGIDTRDPNMPFTLVGIGFEELHDNPRFIEIINKLDLPLP